MSTGTHTTSAAPTETTAESAGASLLQRECACGGSPGLDGMCAECREHYHRGAAPENDQPCGGGDAG